MRARSAAEILAIENMRRRRADSGEYRSLVVLPSFLHSEEEKDVQLDPGKTGQIAAQNMTKDTFRDLSWRVSLVSEKTIREIMYN